MAEAELLTWIEGWYESVCDGEREHSYGVKIETLDNPGWSVKIELRDSEFERMEERELKTDESETDWLVCRIKDRKFEGFGDPRKLTQILRTFRDWIEHS